MLMYLLIVYPSKDFRQGNFWNKVRNLYSILLTLKETMQSQLTRELI